MFRVVLSTAFSIISKTCFPAFPKMHVISFSRSLDHPPCTSMIKLSLVILYTGHSLDNSSLSDPYLLVFSVSFFARLSTQWQLISTMSNFLALWSTKRASTRFSRARVLLLLLLLLLLLSLLVLLSLSLFFYYYQNHYFYEFEGARLNMWTKVLQ